MLTWEGGGEWVRRERSKIHQKKGSAKNTFVEEDCAGGRDRARLKEARADATAVSEASATAMLKWLPLGLVARQLSLPVTLTCGQSFRWVALQDGRWGGVVAGRLVLLRQRNDAIEFSPVNCSAAGGEAEAEKQTRVLLLDYFQSGAPLERMYEDWSRRALRRSAAARRLMLVQAGPTSASSSCPSCSRAYAFCGRTLTSACSHSCAAATTTSWFGSMPPRPQL